MVALQHLADLAAPPLDVAIARAHVEHLQDGLPLTLLAARPEEIRRLARHALDAEKAALRRRSKVGDEPAIDEGATLAALDAHAAVKAARQGLSAARSDAMRWLAIGNAWGLAGLGAATALVMRGGFEPMSTPVYNVVVAAAVGPVATTMLGLTRRSVSSLRLATAITDWTRALAASGFDTMGELCARRIARNGWQRRVAEADAANAVARDARGAWHRVAGPRSHPREAPALIARLTVLRAAQLELLRALIGERTSVQEVAPFDVVWAVPAPADDVVDASEDGDDGSHRFSQAVGHVRARALRLWSR